MTHGVNILAKFQLSSSNGLGVMMFLRLGGKGSLTNLISDGGVCRTAPGYTGSGKYCSVTVYSVEHAVPTRYLSQRHLWASFDRKCGVIFYSEHTALCAVLLASISLASCRK